MSSPVRAGVLILAITSLPLAVGAQAEEPLDLDMVNRIHDEGFNRSQVMETLGYLADVIGPRLTASPQMEAANLWSREKFTEWGLVNAHLDPFDFGRGWGYSKILVRMTGPRLVQLHALPLSWHPGTNGVIEGDVVHAKIESEKDFEAWHGKLEGKIVLLGDGGTPSTPERPAFRRLTDDELGDRQTYRIPEAEPDEEPGRFAKVFTFQPRLFAFLAEEGAIAAVRRSPRDAGLIEASAYMHRSGESPEIPGISMASEDFRRILRLLDRELPVRLELEVEARFYDGDGRSANTLAEIPGRGRDPEIVMAGAHLDSWFAGDGAVDNGAGSAIVMEAARILATLGVKPRRTIRFALWGGEEQGLYGSQTHVENTFARRAAPEDAELASLPAFFWYEHGGALTTRPAYEKLSVYFNIDNGSGRIRGIYGESNHAARPIFERWFEPFHDLGAGTVVLNHTGGTDHLFFQWVGLPGFQFIQDPLDYGSRLHHSQVDTLDHVQEKDIRQASVILASFLYHAAMREERFPRRPSSAAAPVP